MKDFRALKVWAIEYHLLLAHDLAFMNTSDYEQFTNEVAEVKRMLTSSIKRLKAES